MIAGKKAGKHDCGPSISSTFSRLPIGDDQRRTAPRKAIPAIPAATKRKGAADVEGEKPEKRAKPTTEVERRRLRSSNYLAATSS